MKNIKEWKIWKKVHIPIILLVIILVFNIIMLVQPVYKGTYRAKINNTNYSVRFYQNTYDRKSYKNGGLSSYSQGFYQYIKASEYYKAKNNSIILDDSYLLVRKSVFVLQEDKDKYVCAVAIVWQVLFVICYILCIIWFIKIKKQGNFKNLNNLDENKSETKEESTTVDEEIEKYIDEIF